MKSDTLKHSTRKPLQSLLGRLIANRRNGQGPIAELNYVIDAHQVSLDVNESVIESILCRWQRLDHRDLPQYWLLAARLFELAVLCAGHYVDNCEITAAGDLLFNPRKILVYQKGISSPWVRSRHERLSAQLIDKMASRQPFPDWRKSHVFTQTVEPAIVPYLLSRLQHSRRMAQSYLQTAHARVQKAAEAIAFLGAWSMPSAEALHDHMQTASPETRRFIAVILVLLIRHFSMPWEERFTGFAPARIFAANFFFNIYGFTLRRPAPTTLNSRRRL